MPSNPPPAYPSPATFPYHSIGCTCAVCANGPPDAQRAVLRSALWTVPPVCTDRWTRDDWYRWNLHQDEIRARLAELTDA